jgi:four helix bundle protein
VGLVGQLPKTRVAEVLGRQILKSGTSIGAKYRAANRAESREDFIHKIAICEKEAAETEYWIELMDEARLARSETLRQLLEDSRELLAIFVASGRTAKSHR